MKHPDLLFWQFIATFLENGEEGMLLVVGESTGSSPGRQGFKMAVTTNGEMCGSIGGGIMEHKLVELAKEKLRKNEMTPFLKKQIHRKETASLLTAGERSGMICSGEQTVIFFPLKSFRLPDIHRIIRCLENGIPAVMILSPGTFAVSENTNPKVINFRKGSPDFVFEQNLGYSKRAFIIGAGHCGLALSELLANLDFFVTLLDDRPGLNTFEKNRFAHQKQIVDYDRIAEFVPPGEQHYVVIMTLGYRSDELIIRQLIAHDYIYIGVLGSEAKAQKLLENLRTDNFSEERLAKLRIPAGLKIHSQTPMEIAVSIAAEMISVA